MSFDLAECDHIPLSIMLKGSSLILTETGSLCFLWMHACVGK